MNGLEVPQLPLYQCARSLRNHQGVYMEEKERRVVQARGSLGRLGMARSDISCPQVLVCVSGPRELAAPGGPHAGCPALRPPRHHPLHDLTVSRICTLSSCPWGHPPPCKDFSVWRLTRSLSVPGPPTPLWRWACVRRAAPEPYPPFLSRNGQDRCTDSEITVLPLGAGRGLADPQGPCPSSCP